MADNPPATDSPRWLMGTARQYSTGRRRRPTRRRNPPAHGCRRMAGNDPAGLRRRLPRTRRYGGWHAGVMKACSSPPRRQCPRRRRSRQCRKSAQVPLRSAGMRSWIQQPGLPPSFDRPLVPSDLPGQLPPAPAAPRPLQRRLSAGSRPNRLSGSVSGAAASRGGNFGDGRSLAALVAAERVDVRAGPPPRLRQCQPLSLSPLPQPAPERPRLRRTASRARKSAMNRVMTGQLPAPGEVFADDGRRRRDRFRGGG